ncbi:hypothetical protein CPB86DRAFT_712048 [Serendipita vermifera]|nr:hypothetical protein CPB86DRAFT_712048 [Serendipita vermifera]
MTISLLFASTSTRNTAISCDSLGIHYEVSDEDGTTSLHKWNSEKNENALIGHFQVPRLSSDKIKWPGQDEWKPLDTFMGKPTKNPFATTFNGADGTEYRWTSELRSLVMYKVADNSDDHPLVRFHRRYFDQGQSSLEIIDDSVMPDLDHIVLTFLIMEKKRRDRQKFTSSWV